QAMQRLKPEQQALLESIRTLAGSRRRAIQRQALQARYMRLLQGMRIIHIPLTLLCMPLIVVHVIGALDVPAKVLPLGTIPFAPLSGIERSSECKSCHRAIYDQWASSMHSHALTSPLTLAQNNQLIKAELGSKTEPDPRRLCLQCHGPVGTALANQDTLPFDSAIYDRALLNEGIGCSACHQRTGGATKPSAAGL